MTTKDWITKNLPELNQNQVTMLERFIEDREREVRADELGMLELEVARMYYPNNMASGGAVPIIVIEDRIKALTTKTTKGE